MTIMPGAGWGRAFSPRTRFPTGLAGRKAGCGQNCPPHMGWVGEPSLSVVLAPDLVGIVHARGRLGMGIQRITRRGGIKKPRVFRFHAVGSEVGNCRKKIGEV